MSVSDQDLYYSYMGDGSSTLFPFLCKVLDAMDLKVRVASELQTLGTHYNVIGAGEANGGMIQFIAAPATGVTVEIERELSLERTADYLTAGDFGAAAVNRDLDRLCMLVQQALFQATRATTVVLSEGTPGTATVIFADCSSGPVVAELPASGEVVVVKTDNTENAVIITPTTVGQTIMGAAELEISIQNESARFILNTDKWYRI